MSDRLFPLDEIPEVPLFRPPAPRKGARGGWQDERLSHDYPPEWDRCTTCSGSGKVSARRVPAGFTKDIFMQDLCPDCLGMGSLKARVRLEAGHRCVRCRHPYVPQVDAAMLGVEPSGMHDCSGCAGCGEVSIVMKYRSVGLSLPGDVTSEPCPGCKGEGRVWTPWSACDEQCTHGGPWRAKQPPDGAWREFDGRTQREGLDDAGLWTSWDGLLEDGLEAEWRILTVHHLDGDKANVRWWNLASLCQVCHLHIQHKVVMERVWPHEHSEWFRPFVAGYYAFVYLGEELTRPEVDERMDELLALERVA